MMNKEKLLPCPHCGGEAKIDMLDIGRYLYAVECENCGCGTGHEETEEEAMTAWNKRTPEIVYCRECVHSCNKVYSAIPTEVIKDFGYTLTCFIHKNDVFFNDYCSFGKRKETK